MRNPERIPIILEELGKYWQNHADLRLGQIVHNMICGKSGYVDTFYAEDDVILHWLRVDNWKDSGIPIENFAEELEKCETTTMEKEKAFSLLD